MSMMGKMCGAISFWKEKKFQIPNIEIRVHCVWKYVNQSQTIRTLCLRTSIFLFINEMNYFTKNVSSRYTYTYTSDILIILVHFSNKIKKRISKTRVLDK